MKWSKDLINAGLAVITTVVTLRSSVPTIDRVVIHQSSIKNTFPRLLVPGCSGDIDCGEQAVSCRTDIECNPTIAHPERFISRCLNSWGGVNDFESDGLGTCH